MASRKRNLFVLAVLLIAVLLALAFYLGKDAVKPEAKVSIRAENEYMQAAVDEAIIGITHRHGGPFGSVVVKDGKIVGKGHNQVVKNNDPSCHGEISAIRDACRKLRTYDLTGCELYTTGEPCTMCLCACLWANIDKVYYGCTIEDNAMIGFRDEKFEKLFGGLNELGDYLVCVDRDACLELFNVYLNIGHTLY